MAHEVETMAFFGHLPWHGLGIALEEADLYDWPAPARRRAWIGSRIWSRLSPPTRRPRSITGPCAARQTPGCWASSAPATHVLQNKDAFSWFQPFLDAREAALHTAGSLRSGSRIWVLAKLNRDPAGDCRRGRSRKIHSALPRPRWQPCRPRRFHPDPGRLPEHTERWLTAPTPAS